MSRQTRYPKYQLLGVDIDAITMDQANAYIIDWAGTANRPAMYVVKPYVEFLDRASDNIKLRALLNNAELSFPDGVALSWAATYLDGGPRTRARLLRTLAAIVLRPASLRGQLPERFAGANATWSLLEAASTHKLKVFIMASPHGQTDLSHASATIAARLPNLQIVGTHAGEIYGHTGAELQRQLDAGLNLSDLAREITTTGADIILIGMGFPLQEAIMAALQPLLSHGVMIGEGGTFDYASFGGNQTRAPELIQRIGLEWLWRLILEPSRWHRQLAIPRFIAKIYRLKP